MKIDEQLITPNKYSRPQKKIVTVKSVVMHWTVVPMQSAQEVRDFYDGRQSGMAGYGSAHYIIGLNGEIIRCVPEDEIAYHCGTSQVDPVSGRIYTDYARKKFGLFATERASPNFCTLGIEMCVADRLGSYKDRTVQSAIELCADICRRYGLAADDITTHHNVVGWKNCPRLWTDRPELFDAFRASVADYMLRSV